MEPRRVFLKMEGIPAYPRAHTEVWCWGWGGGGGCLQEQSPHLRPGVQGEGPGLRKQWFPHGSKMGHKAMRVGAQMVGEEQRRPKPSRGASRNW